ncbi:MAG: ChaN family lipoprotein [Desulfobacterota bacterium]|nr:ChaN family lipoprotein [Thermodesulfobacteriota bacterium]
MSFVQTTFLALVCLCIIGCTGLRHPQPQTGTVEGLAERFRPGQIVDLARGEAVDFEELIARLSSKDLIFVGEAHDNPDHHLIQIQILQAVASRSPSLTMGMEFFQRPHQPILDRYIEGESTEKEFLEAVDWKRSWGFDYRFYRPLMQFARERKYRVLALNAPNTLVRKVARSGLKSLEPSERDQLPKDIDLLQDGHRAFLRRLYEEHAPHDLKEFEFFYEAQCVWEETMASTLAEHLGPGKNRLIAFTGNGHIVNKFGIPDRTVRRVPASVVTVMPYPLNGQETIDRSSADYVWFTLPSPQRYSMGTGGFW